MVAWRSTGCHHVCFGPSEPLPMESDQLARVVEYLGSKFLRGQPVLFTGAGYSLAARDQDGRSLPTGEKLAGELWKASGVTEDLDEDSSLQEVYQVALRSKFGAVKELLTGRFRVDQASLPGFYRLYYSLPWYRHYTINIDDLEIAASVKFTLDRKPIPISGVYSPRFSSDQARYSPSDLEVIHLNGTIDDLPDRVTFSTRQYADRSNYSDPYFSLLAADLVSRPFVFVGSKLDEAALWAQIEMRRGRGSRDMRELRPQSYLVSPTLSVAKREMLKEYNIDWIPMSAEEFADAVLQSVEKIVLAGARTTVATESDRGGGPLIPLAADLATQEERQKTEYLLGEEPHWSDVIDGKAITRDVDEQMLARCKASLEGDASTVLAILGTAGAGKSSSLMRAAWALTSDGLNVGYCDRDTEISAMGLVHAFDRQEELRVLAIDDAGRFGEVLARTVSEIALRRPGCLILVGLSSSAAERYLPSKAIRSATLDSVVLPGLTDTDIDRLIDTLREHNRLGVLVKKSLEERRAAFRDSAGRQLLVAMIQATSGKRFQEKVIDEFEDLTMDEKHLYALIAVATGRSFGLTTAEVLVASGHSSNEALNHLESLAKRRLLVAHPDKGGVMYRLRHREIARVVTEYLAKISQLKDLIEGIAFAGACTVSPVMPRNSRAWRLLKAFISHRYLSRVLDLISAREIYDHLESPLAEDHHFWLQRGSLEVRSGDLDLAQHFLGTARSLNSEDALVVTECALLEMKLAIRNPTSPTSHTRFNAAVVLLEGLIAERGERDAHPYHILGSQVLSWARLGVGDRDEVQDLLRRVIAHVEEAHRRHPGSRDLEGLGAALQKELLLTHVD